MKIGLDKKVTDRVKETIAKRKGGHVSGSEHLSAIGNDFSYLLHYIECLEGKINENRINK